MDILDCSTAEKSVSGAKMLLMRPGSDDVLTHQAKGDDEPVEMYLILLGPESPKVQRALAQARHRASRDKDDHSPSDEKIVNEARADSKLLASLTVGGLVFMNGAWLKITTENAFDVYFAVKPFRGQALKFALDEGNFTKG